LNSKANLESGSSHSSFERLVPGIFTLGLIGSTCTAQPSAKWAAAAALAARVVGPGVDADADAASRSSSALLAPASASWMSAAPERASGLMSCDDGAAGAAAAAAAAADASAASAAT